MDPAVLKDAMYPNYAILVDYKGGQWERSPVPFPPGTDSETAKQLLVNLYTKSSGAPCFHCKATKGDKYAAGWVLMITDEAGCDKHAVHHGVFVTHCAKEECRVAAVKQVNLYGKEMAAGTGRNYYRCHVCTNTGEHLKKCSRCLMARYCSAECQRAAYPEHKKTCKAKTGGQGVTEDV